MGHAAVLVRGAATLPRDVRWDQPEHSRPLEVECATNKDARQENFAVARRHDAAKRAHYAGDRRPVPQRGDNQRLCARMARRTGARRSSRARVGQAALWWHALELREARQVLERAPQPCSARGQHAPAVHQAVLAHGQARCQRRPRRGHRRDLLQPPSGRSNRVGAAAASNRSPAGKAKEATTFTVAFSMDGGALDMLVQIVDAGKTDAVLPEQPCLQLAASLDYVMNPSEEGQAWILLWDVASIHASEATLAAMKAAFPHVVLCFIPPRSTSYLQPCDVAVFRSFKSCIQTQASATLARSVLDGSFEGLAMNKAWRRQSSAEWAARAVTDLCDENKAWTTGWRPLRAHSDAHFKEAVAEAAALHAHDELFSKHIEPEPAPEDPVDWAMAEASDDEDDAPMPDAPPEPEIIDMPPAPASAPLMSNLERCIALRLVYGAGPR